jgi:hypothetical protein
MSKFFTNEGVSNEKQMHFERKSGPEGGSGNFGFDCGGIGFCGVSGGALQFRGRF